METFTSVIGLFLCVIIVYFYRRRIHQLPPGPRGYPIIGNLFEMFYNESDKPLCQYLTELSKKYGDVFTFNPGFGSTMIILNNADTIKQALVNQAGQFDCRPAVWSFDNLTKKKDILMGDQSHPIWGLSRRLATSGFRSFLSGSRLDGKLHCSVEKGISILSKNIGKTIDIKEHLNLIIYNVICDMLFSNQFDMNDKEFVKLYNTVEQLDAKFGAGLLEDWIPLWQYSPIKTTFTKTYIKDRDILLAYVVKQVEWHQQNYDPDNIHDLIDFLMNAREKVNIEDPELATQFTNEHIMEICVDLFLGGVDTTTHTLYWIFYFMARYPHIQEKVQREIDEVVGISLPKYADKQNMVYCEAVMHEVLRCSPIAPLGAFHSSSADNHKLYGYDIPNGAMMITNIWACHHDPREWKNPDDFTPERFIHEDGSSVVRPKSWLPFSTGRRACIGENVAKHEIFIIFTSILQKFDIKFADEDIKTNPVKYAYNLFVCIPQPYKVIVTPRG